MSEKVKQAIHVGRHVTDIMRLPCVYSCHKEADGTLCYLLYDWDAQGNYIEAHEGQWLCEDYDGKWTVRDSLTPDPSPKGEGKSLSPAPPDKKEPTPALPKGGGLPTPSPSAPIC